jgi:selenide,water dikinase
VDFFAPVVDDPHAYGEIAAANALSDVYAMGGEPRTALAIAALPKDGPGAEVIRAIFLGGYETLTEAGTVLLGGHTVSNDELKFGYAVTGEVDPSRVWTNAGARVGDELVLTKPLGTGIITTAIKFGRASERQIAAVTASMRRLNRDAATSLRRLPAGAVSACTDVTGFGLAGHASEMASASGVTLVVDLGALPLIEGAASLAVANVPGGGRTNADYFLPKITFASPPPDALRVVAFDPQTSGGLLVAIDPAARVAFLRDLAKAGVEGRVIGGVERRHADDVLVHFVDTGSM